MVALSVTKVVDRMLCRRSVTGVTMERVMRQGREFKDQLPAIGARSNDGRAAVRPVSQVTVRLKASDKKDQFAATIDSILQWMNKRAGKTLPAAAWQRQSFELSEIGAQTTAAVALKDPKYWAARLDDADKLVPMRTWVTEIGVGVDANADVLFGVRLVCATRGIDEPYERTIPGFVKSIFASAIVELDGRVVEKVPQFVQSPADVEDLVRLLESPNRQADVLIFSLPEGSKNLPKL